MREIALHVLDLIENAIRAGAAVISVSVEEELNKDSLLVSVEDDGPGLPVAGEIAVDPFFTTKEGKKTGLGLSLLKFRAEQAGGCFRMERSPLGGLAVRASMPLSSVDRSPLGDLAATLASVVCTNPEIELRSRLKVGDKEWAVSTVDIARTLPVGGRGPIAVARRMKERIKEGLAALHVSE
ncbi:MAG TPA: ATP-binding protein [Spirochaetia bacterium]|nr:ATP-binding protein [Spirochaetia bacterium]